MRLVKMLGLVTVASAVAMAFMGAPSATATSTAFCETHVVGPCDPTKIKTGHFEAVATTNILLKVFGATATCKNSKILGEALGLGAQLIVHFTEFTLVECDCTVTITDKAGLIKLLKVSLNLAEAFLEGIDVLVKCMAPPDCVFETIPTLHVEGGNPAIVKANEAAPVSGGMLCMQGVKFTGTYAIELPKPVFITS